MKENSEARTKAVLLFGGTKEGHQLADILTGRGQQVVLSVATEYGEAVLEPELRSRPLLTVRSGRLDRTQMEKLMEEGDFGMVIDATHPYAVQVSEQIRDLCGRMGILLLRCLRPSEGPEGDISFSGIEEAVQWLSGQEGNVLVTTGAKEIAGFQNMRDFQNRVYARVLPAVSSLEACLNTGLRGRHIIAMQGPFSAHTNFSQLKEFDCRFLVTKYTGTQGGYAEKAEGARLAGARLLVIGRPSEEKGLTLRETISAWEKWSGWKPRRLVRIVGAGMGSISGLTGTARDAVCRAQALTGAKRLIEGMRPLNPDCPVLETYRPEEMVQWLETFSWSEAAAVMSGDVGFFSGAWAAGRAFSEKGWQVEFIPGISCMSWFAAAVKRPWQQMAVMSCHGRDSDGAEWIRSHPLSFILLGDPQKLLTELEAGGMEHCRLWIGENFGTENQRIEEGNCSQLLELHRQQPFGSLSCLIAENPEAGGNEKMPAGPAFGLPDGAFTRGKVPMTKGEIRAISLSKLALEPGSVCYDIGAGTGSVAVEMGRILRMMGSGSVYGVEYRPEALKLIRTNGQRLLEGWKGFHVVQGKAPEALELLPPPTHVFLGGTGGGLKSIVACLLQKNPQVRIVANALTPQTMSALLECRREFQFARWEMIQASVTAYEAAGAYLMPKAGNPIYIVVMEGGKEGGEADCTR